uniref:MARVEL domain-containing protein n=1 Tax=Panagrellus redivivus TaxID=6233 RepID=A0A7E4W8P5_PANRE
MPAWSWLIGIVSIECLLMGGWLFREYHVFDYSCLLMRHNSTTSVSSGTGFSPRILYVSPERENGRSVRNLRVIEFNSSVPRLISSGKFEDVSLKILMDNDPAMLFDDMAPMLLKRKKRQINNGDEKVELVPKRKHKNRLNGENSRQSTSVESVVLIEQLPVSHPEPEGAQSIKMKTTRIKQVPAPVKKRKRLRKRPKHAKNNDGMSPREVGKDAASQTEDVVKVKPLSSTKKPRRQSNRNRQNGRTTGNRARTEERALNSKQIPDETVDDDEVIPEPVLGPVLSAPKPRIQSHRNRASAGRTAGSRARAKAKADAIASLGAETPEPERKTTATTPASTTTTITPRPSNETTPANGSPMADIGIKMISEAISGKSDEKDDKDKKKDDDADKTTTTSTEPSTTTETLRLAPNGIEHPRKETNFQEQLEMFASLALCIARTLLDVWCAAQLIASLPFLLGVCLRVRCLFIVRLMLDALFLVILFIYMITIITFTVILYALVGEMTTEVVTDWLIFGAILLAVLIVYTAAFTITLRCCELVLNAKQRPYKERRSKSLLYTEIGSEQLLETAEDV